MEIDSGDIAGPTRDYVRYGRHVPKVVWPGGANVAVNTVVNYEERPEIPMAADGRNEPHRGEMP